MRLTRLLALAALAAGGPVPALGAQSLVYRPPNLGGTWVPAGGVLQFNFMHRFVVASSAGSHKVTNFPTFTFALGLGHGLGFGTHYGTNSLLVLTPYRPNEFELFARWRLGVAEGTPGLAVSVTPAYNTAARSVDGELAADYTAGPLTVSGAVRGIGKPFGAGDARAALAGGATLRLNDYVALNGDVASYLGLDTTVAWSAGIAVVIPGSPHTFSLHASTAASNSIQGASWGVSRTMYGFEFTIPIHFSRFAPWFARRSRERAVEINVPFMNAAARVTVQGMRFTADSVVIAAGQSVGWTNRDQVAHTVTFTGGGLTGSGDIAPNGTFAVTFARPGVYRYRCGPHPAMQGVVVVQ